MGEKKAREALLQYRLSKRPLSSNIGQPINTHSHRTLAPPATRTGVLSRQTEARGRGRQGAGDVATEPDDGAAMAVGESRRVQGEGRGRARGNRLHGRVMAGEWDVVRPGREENVR